ncbi:hypothetical protein EAH77_12255 [Ewingella americana]|uniref:Uncharacterized protein n=1 Tax=Ewingella americana TaxID=41202 RepID=A0A502GJ54_9GAMM|nr:hypothetical protein EAH77_12255 [Ewingella americana]
MTLLYVQFTDTTEAVIISYFGGPQPIESWHNQGTVDSSDQRWSIYFDEQPVMLQRFLTPPTQDK